MNEPIENEYFNWLFAKSYDRDNPRMYVDLIKILHSTEFIWVVPGDKHRCDDGIELRTDFFRETRTEPDEALMSQPCSVLEVLIAFARRANFQTSHMSLRKWFWIFMENLLLDQYRQVTLTDLPKINDILNRFIWRLYDSHGFGGLFPLSHTIHDQRKVEIWYQFCEYLEERGMM